MVNILDQKTFCHWLDRPELFAFLHLLTELIKSSSLRIAPPRNEADKTGVDFL